MALSRPNIVLALISVAGAVKLIDMKQGEEFTKCIKIEDFKTKTLADEIQLADRELSGGCCPDKTVPGVKFYSSYMSAQVVCGFKDDGSISLTTGSSNGVKTCTYNKCFVQKQNIGCKDGTKQLLNGCCGTKPQTNFKDDCKSYDNSFTSVYGDAVPYCRTYNKVFKMEGTTDKTDDIKDGILVIDNLYTYTPCKGGSSTGGGGSSSTGGGGSSSTGGGSSSTSSNIDADGASRNAFAATLFVLLALMMP